MSFSVPACVENQTETTDRYNLLKNYITDTRRLMKNYKDTTGPEGRANTFASRFLEAKQELFDNNVMIQEIMRAMPDTFSIFDNYSAGLSSLLDCRKFNYLIYK